MSEQITPFTPTDGISQRFTTGPANQTTHNQQPAADNGHSVEQQIENIQNLVQDAFDETSQYELSVVMPCLNEADTLATCIEKCLTVFEEHQLSCRSRDRRQRKY